MAVRGLGFGAEGLETPTVFRHLWSDLTEVAYPQGPVVEAVCGVLARTRRASSGGPAECVILQGNRERDRSGYCAKYRSASSAVSEPYPRPRETEQIT